VGSGAEEATNHPSADLRTLEIKANDAFYRYAQMDFDVALTSVYLFDTEQGFGGCFLVKKSK
jgi:capping protein beta